VRRGRWTRGSAQIVTHHRIGTKTRKVKRHFYYFDLISRVQFETHVLFGFTADPKGSCIIAGPKRSWGSRWRERRTEASRFGPDAPLTKHKRFLIFRRPSCPTRPKGDLVRHFFSRPRLPPASSSSDTGSSSYSQTAGIGSTTSPERERGAHGGRRYACPSAPAPRPSAPRGYCDQVGVERRACLPDGTGASMRRASSAV
jgi:hypothetical protein